MPLRRPFPSTSSIAILARGAHPGSDGPPPPLMSVLPNGVSIVTRTRPGARVVAIDVAVRAGARYEALHTAGAARFLERAILGGTERWPTRDQLLRAISARGGELSATAGRETVEVRVAIGQDDLDLALGVVRDVLLASRFDAATLEAERATILTQIAQREDNPESLASDILFDTVFAGHPLGNRPTGTAEGVRRLAPDTLRAYWRERLVGPNAIVGVVAGLDHAALVQRVDAALGDIPDGPATPVNATPMPMAAGRSIRVEAGESQAHVFVGVPIPGVTADGRAALRVANAVLGRASGRLYTDIRDRRGLAYSTYSSVAQYSDGGIMFAYAGTDPANADAARELTVQELVRLRDEPLGPAELDNARGGEAGARILDREKSADEAVALARNVLFGLPPAEAQDAQLRAVTADDVQAAARAYLGIDRMSIVVAQPERASPDEEDEA